MLHTWLRQAWLRDERGDWPDKLMTLLIFGLGGAAALFGLLAGGREMGGNITSDFRDMTTDGTLVDANTTGLSGTVQTGKTGAITGVQ